MSPETLRFAFGSTWLEIGGAVGLGLLAAALAAPSMLSGMRLSSPLAGARRLGGTFLAIAPAILLLCWIVMRSAPHVLDAPGGFWSNMVWNRGGADGAESRPNELLKIRQMSSVAPSWADATPDPKGDSTTVVVSSQRFATLEEAERQATERVLALVHSHFHDEHPQRGAWQAPLSEVEAHAVEQVTGESLDKDFGNGIQGRMYRVHARLNLSPELRKALYGTWRAQVVDRRLTILGSILALVTLMLGTSATYIRLDDRTGGQLRWRLRFAALATIMAGGLMASSVIGRFEFPLG